MQPSSPGRWAVDASDIKYQLHLDALVVGVGFAGLYALYLLKQRGFDVRALESGADVGGTWFWNRYPGARSDVESYVYRYSWDKELNQEAQWSHNYLHQPELLAYFQQVAKKHELYPLIQFNTDLVEAAWDDDKKTWRVKASTGEVFVVRYLVTGLGVVHSKYEPDLPGLDTFKGRVTHSASWTPDIEWENKRIAVIGSGASGVQLVSSLSEKAQTLTHFVRHAQYVLPAAYKPVSPEERKLINERYDKIWNQVFTSGTGFGFAEPGRPTFSLSPEDRETVFQDLWEAGSGFRFLFGGFSDLLTNEDANKEAIKFIHKKIKETVKDEQKAAVLTSSDWFARRPLTDDLYYERLNQDNVFAVDLQKTPISTIVPEGIKTADGKVHPVDLIVLATGFDAFDGGYARVHFTGRGGKTLKEHWAEGPRVSVGVATSEFPNLLFVNGPGGPFSNGAPSAEITARFVDDLIARAEETRTKKGGADATAIVEATPEGEQAWRQELVKASESNLFSKTPSWFFGENIPGKARAPRAYFGGVSGFRAFVADLKSKGFAGFRFE
ncbi:hypothetical protein DV735_g2823, partial [Chaetothyriales sp. CBS 134920]